MPGRTFSREFKLRVLRQLASGEKRPAQVCGEHNLSQSMISRWRQEYEARGEEALRAKPLSESEALAARVAELERFCGQLAWENSVLKKTLARQKSARDTP
jgi:putative transposase